VVPAVPWVAPRDTVIWSADTRTSRSYVATAVDALNPNSPPESSAPASTDEITIVLTVFHGNLPFHSLAGYVHSWAKLTAYRELGRTPTIGENRGLGSSDLEPASLASAVTVSEIRTSAPQHQMRLPFVRS